MSATGQPVLIAIPGRACGQCQVCCIAPRIDDPQLQKPAGQVCPNLDASGCTIYETRPGTCRSWLCGWRLQAELDDSWRPDLCGVLLMPQMQPTPGFRSMGYTMQLTSRTALTSPEVLNRLCGFIAGETPMYLALEGRGGKIFLNPQLTAPIAAGNGPAIMTALSSALRELTTA